MRCCRWVCTLWCMPLWPLSLRGRSRRRCSSGPSSCWSSHRRATGRRTACRIAGGADERRWTAERTVHSPRAPCGRPHRHSPSAAPSRLPLSVIVPPLRRPPIARAPPPASQRSSSPHGQLHAHRPQPPLAHCVIRVEAATHRRRRGGELPHAAHPAASRCRARRSRGGGR